MAMAFYSRLPVGQAIHLEIPQLNRIARGIPIGGLIIGLGPALVLLLCSLAGWPPLFTGFLAAACFAIATGAMSEDALADSLDALFGGATPQRRLEIFKDSRHGTYGVLALVVLIALKATALAALAEYDPLGAAALWLAATTAARTGSLAIPLVVPVAGSGGLAATVGTLDRNAFLVSVVLALGIVLALALPFAGWAAALVALAAGAAMVIFWIWICRKLVGGVTGDLIGAGQALLEIAMLTAFMGSIA